MNSVITNENWKYRTSGEEHIIKPKTLSSSCRQDLCIFNAKTDKVRNKVSCKCLFVHFNEKKEKYPTSSRTSTKYLHKAVKTYIWLLKLNVSFNITYLNLGSCNSYKSAGIVIESVMQMWDIKEYKVSPFTLSINSKYEYILL